MQPHIKRPALHALAEPFGHRNFILCAKCEFRLADHCVDRPALVHGERPVPVVDEEGELGADITHFGDHFLHLPEVNFLDLRVSVVDLVGNVVVESAQKVIHCRARVEVFKAAALALVDAAIPLEGKIFAVHIAAHFFSGIP